MKKGFLLVGLVILGTVMGMITWKVTEALTGTDAPMFSTTYPECDRYEYKLAIWPMLEEHFEEIQLALSASPSELQGSVERLQQIRQDVSVLVAPSACEDIRQANTYMLNAMDNAISMFVARMNGEPNSVINEYGHVGADWIDEFKALVSTW